MTQEVAEVADPFADLTADEQEKANDLLAAQWDRSLEKAWVDAVIAKGRDGEKRYAEAYHRFRCQIAEAIRSSRVE